MPSVFNVIALLVAVAVNLVAGRIADPAVDFFIAGALATGVHVFALTLLIAIDDRYHFSHHFAGHTAAHQPPSDERQSGAPTRRRTGYRIALAVA